jgi:large subunit ribosomal protein L23
MNSRESQIILNPIINEKTISLAASNKYTFAVANDANKTEIAHALKQIISELYPKNKCTIIKVNTSYVRDRFRRSKRHGRSPKDFKKAIVTIEGDALDFYNQ